MPAAETLGLSAGSARGGDPTAAWSAPGWPMPRPTCRWASPDRGRGRGLVYAAPLPAGGGVLAFHTDADRPATRETRSAEGLLERAKRLRLWGNLRRRDVDAYRAQGFAPPPAAVSNPRPGQAGLPSAMRRRVMIRWRRRASLMPFIPVLRRPKAPIGHCRATRWRCPAILRSYEMLASPTSIILQRGTALSSPGRKAPSGSGVTVWARRGRYRC